MATQSSRRKLSSPSAPRLSSGRRIKRSTRNNVAVDTVFARPPGDLEDSTEASILIQTRRRDPQWSGWSFTSDITFDEPVDIDELIDRAADANA